MSDPQVFPGSRLCLGRQDLVRLARLPGSEGPGCVIIDQVLCVLGGGNSGAGWCGRRVVVAAVTAEVLSLTLEEEISQDGCDHYDGDDQEDSNGHLHRTWERTGRVRRAKGLSGSDLPPSLHRIKTMDVTCRSRTPKADLQDSCFQKPRAALTEDN